MSLADSYDEMDQFLIGDEDELAGPIGNEEQVERMLRAVAYRHRKLAQALELIAAEKERLAAYEEQMRKRYDTSFFEDCLRSYHAARLDEDPKAKTLRFPSGELVSRAGQPRWDIDPDTFIPWATASAPDLLRTRVEPDKAAIKKALEVSGPNAVNAAGEVVPGVTVEPAEVSFTVKVGDDGA